MESLVITDGLFKAARFPLSGKQMIIGRSADVDIRLPDASVSRQHARIDRVRDAFSIVDLGSLNGTRLNGDRLQGPHPLEDGDEIRIGDVTLVFKSDISGMEIQTEELGRRHRSYIEAICRYQAQVARVESWEAVVTILCQTIVRLTDPKPRVQAVQEFEDGLYLPYVSGDDDDTFYPLPPRQTIEEAVATGETERLSAGRALIPFEPNGTPIRALHVVGKRLSDNDLEMIAYAVGATSRTPAFNPDAGSGMTMVLNPGALDAIIGDSSPIKEAKKQITRAASATAPVLILGESGTGKELAARAVHELGPRADKPFVAFNCAGLAPELIDSELFGHEKGAFTGANQQHPGLFEQAGEGTLFLDEVAELPLPAQAKLLRTLDTGEIRRVGATEVLQARARIVCATNADLEAMIEDGAFRLDLYYRIAGFILDIPPLRKRRSDIPRLIRHFLSVYAEEANVPVPAMSDEAMERLVAYDWPGNVRELEMLVRRLVYAADKRTIRPDDLSFSGAGRVGGEEETDHVSLKEVERRHIEAVLKSCNGNKTRASEILGIARVTLYQKLKTYAEEEE